MVADSVLGFPSRPGPADALQHSDFPREEVRKSPEAVPRRVFTAFVSGGRVGRLC